VLTSDAAMAQKMMYPKRRNQYSTDTLNHIIHRTVTAR
jgi:hypothetical protein